MFGCKCNVCSKKPSSQYDKKCYNCLDEVLVNLEAHFKHLYTAFDREHKELKALKIKYNSVKAKNLNMAKELHELRKQSHCSITTSDDPQSSSSLSFDDFELNSSAFRNTTDSQSGRGPPLWDSDAMDVVSATEPLRIARVFDKHNRHMPRRPEQNAAKGKSLKRTHDQRKSQRLQTTQRQPSSSPDWVAPLSQSASVVCMENLLPVYNISTSEDTAANVTVEPTPKLNKSRGRNFKPIVKCEPVSPTENMTSSARRKQRTDLSAKWSSPGAAMGPLAENRSMERDHQLRPKMSRVEPKAENVGMPMMECTPEAFWNPRIVSFAEDDPRNEVLVDRRFEGRQRQGKYGSFK